MMNDKVRNTPAVLILLAWLLVGVPAGWGVYNTALNAMKLFQKAPAASAVPQK